MGPSAETVYARALDAIEHLDEPQPPWNDVLEGFRQLMGGDSATLILFDGQGGLMSFEQCGVDPAAVQEYAAHYFAEDILTPLAFGAPIGSWFDTAQLFSHATLSRSAYYADFMCRYDARQMVAHIVEDSPLRRGGLTVQRSRASGHRQGHLQNHQMRRFTAKLARALARRTQAADRWFAHADAALASFEEAICLTTSRGLVLRQSRAAQEWLHGGQGLRNDRGQLRHPIDRVDRALQAALVQAARSTQSVALEIPDTPGTTHRIECVRAPSQLCVSSERLVLVRLPLRRHARPDDTLAVLRHAFRLTQAEAAVLNALIQGIPARHYAQERQLSYHTVRSQIAALMQKMDCTRQVDLVREGLRVVPMRH